MARIVEISADYVAGMETEIARLRREVEALDQRAKSAYDAGYMDCSNDYAIRGVLRGEAPVDAAIVHDFVPRTKLTVHPGGSVA